MDEAAILIIGANGQLGTALKQKYPNAQAVDMAQLDITNSEAVNNYDWSSIKIIINAAAYTNVDGAETTEGRVVCWQVNAAAVSNLTKVALERNLTLVHISTEYVFDGTQNPHKENEFLSPLGVYGQTKAAGDVIVGLLPKHYIVRTSWVIGDGKNFVRTMLDLAHKNVSPTVISDDVGRPTFTTELTRAIEHLLTNNAAFGTYNVSNEGDTISWADLARSVFRLAGLDINVTNTTNSEYYADKPEASPRPHNSVFDLSKIHSTGFTSIDWEQDLKDYLKKEVSQ